MDSPTRIMTKDEYLKQIEMWEFEDKLLDGLGIRYHLSMNSGPEGHGLKLIIRTGYLLDDLNPEDVREVLEEWVAKHIKPMPKVRKPRAKKVKT